MAASKIVITFTREFVILEHVEIRRKDINDPLSFGVMKETAQPFRSTGSMLIGTPTANVGEATATEFRRAFTIDYGGYGLYDITQNINVVTIQFRAGLPVDWIFYGEVNTGDATMVVTNTVPQTFAWVANFETFSQATEPCNKVKINLETTELATKLYLNGFLYDNSNTSNPAEIEFLRGIPYWFTLENAVGDKLYWGWNGISGSWGYYYDFLAASNLTIAVVQSLVGATVTVNVVNTKNLVLEVSIDGSNWFPITHAFTGQELGTTTLYVRDQFGCIIQKEYIVNDFGTRLPYLQISDANSIGFKESVEWNGTNYI